MKVTFPQALNIFIFAMRRLGNLLITVDEEQRFVACARALKRSSIELKPPLHETNTTICMHDYQTRHA